jgi:hypothetical protein
LPSLRMDAGGSKRSSLTESPGRESSTADTE